VGKDEDGPLVIFPDERVSYDGPKVMGWLADVPDEYKTAEQEEAHNASTLSDRLLNGAQGLSDILTVLDGRAEEGRTVPTVLYAVNLSREAAKLAYKRLGFYYLGDLPAPFPFEDTYDMATATATLRRKLDALKNKAIRGKTLFERLELRSSK